MQSDLTDSLGSLMDWVSQQQRDTNDLILELIT
jgi:hypothetical protein